MSKPDWENFAKAVLADWPTGDLEGSVLFDLSLQYGMIQEVPGGYNSDRHFDNEGICPEEGDPWYEYTFRGEAGPGLYSIHALTEQLEALTAERDEQIEWVRRLADMQIASETKLAKAVEALRLIEADCDADYPPSHLAIKYAARSTLAEIEGEKG